MKSTLARCGILPLVDVFGPCLYGPSAVVTSSLEMNRTKSNESNFSPRKSDSDVLMTLQSMNLTSDFSKHLLEAGTEGKAGVVNLGTPTR